MELPAVGCDSEGKVLGAAVTSQREKSTSSIIPPPAKYGGRHTVTLIPGDGIGPELLNHVRELFRFCCVPVDFEVVNVNSSLTEEDDINNAITAIRRNGVALKGNIETNHTLPPSHKSRNNLLRNTLCLSPSFIAGLLWNSVCTNSCLCLPLSSQLVSKPQQFDVMVMPNLYGNVVSNVCAGLVGGPGLVPGANYGRDYAVFETATRNTGKSIANKNIANPTAMLLASCMMLDHLNLHTYAAMIRGAVLKTMNETRLHTADIGGQGTTLEVVQSIMRLIQSNGPQTTLAY
nr:PREDICTED: isocitrate dehydrogenase [NAD] subunit gamma, mitochondrial-like [Lepisosteus oculatus]